MQEAARREAAQAREMEESLPEFSLARSERDGRCACSIGSLQFLNPGYHAKKEAEAFRCGLQAKLLFQNLRGYRRRA